MKPIINIDSLYWLTDQESILILPKLLGGVIKKELIVIKLLKKVLTTTPRRLMIF